MYQENILLWGLIAWLVGIALGISIKLPFVVLILFCGILIVSQLVYYWWSKKRITWQSTGSEVAASGILLLLLTCAVTGAFWATAFQVSERPQLPQYIDEKVFVQGTVVSAVRDFGYRQTFTIKANELAVDSGIWQLSELAEVVSYGEYEMPNYGDHVQLSGQVRQISSATNPGAFDYQSYLAQQRIYSQLVVDAEPIILESANKLSFSVMAQNYKQNTIHTILTLLPQVEGKVLAAMTFGWKDGLSDKHVALFTKAGLMHLFAVSGLHMGFLLISILWLIERLQLNKFVAFVSVAMMVYFYAAMADFAVSAVRAALMGTMGMLPLLLKREKNFYSILLLAAFVLTLINPFYLLQAGFQMSFIATWGIVYLYQPLQGIFFQQVNWWKNAIIVPLAAQLALFPILAYHFNFVSLIGLIANIIALWLVFMAVLVGLLIYPISLIIPLLSEMLLIFIGGIIYFFIAFLELITAIPGYFTVKTPSLAAIVFYYMTIIFLVAGQKGQLQSLGKYFFKWHFKKAIIFVGIFLLIGTGVSWYHTYETDVLEIVVLDVGQGDAIFIRLPNGKHVLIDGGGVPSRGDFNTFDVGEKVLLPYLNHRGVKELALVVNTHGHYDHVAGLLPVVNQIKVNHVLLSPLSATSETYETFLNCLEDKRIPTTIAKRGQKINLDERVTLMVLHPDNLIKGTSSDLNENSVVIKLTYGDFSMLFTGDIEKNAMLQLVRADLPLASNVYKVAHHGSNTGLVAEFLAAVNPQVAIIPVGKNNFGHPHPDLLTYFAEKQITVYDTYSHGAITIKSDGTTVQVKTVKQ